MDTHPRWDTARNVLCVRLDAMGDVLMTSPALRALREQAPGRRITLLTSPSATPCARLVPEVDDVIEYAAPWVKESPGRHDAEPDRHMARRLRAACFDAAAIFTVYSQSALPAALLCYLADVPLRLAHSRENPYELLTHRAPETEPEQGVRHEVRRQLDLVARVGATTADERLSLRVPPASRDAVRALLVAAGLRQDRPWAVLHPGASAPSRRYPAPSFAAVARGLVDAGWQVVFSGSAAERALVDDVRASEPGLSLAGALDVAGLAALIDLAPLLIANNSGPVHIAAAVGTPVVDLYALTNPQHAPWGVPHRLLFHDVSCRYCYSSVCREGHHDCLRLVDPRAVVDAALELAAESAAAPRPAALAEARRGGLP